MRAKSFLRHVGFTALLAFATFGPQQAGSAYGQAFAVTGTFDENGNGTFTNTSGFNSALTSTLQNDPGPGGLNSALTYSFFNPPGLTAGDLFLLETVGGPISDVFRFNPNETCSGTTGCLVFYSDNVDG